MLHGTCSSCYLSAIPMYTGYVDLRICSMIDDTSEYVRAAIHPAVFPKVNMALH